MLREKHGGKLGATKMDLLLPLQLFVPLCLPEFAGVSIVTHNEAGSSEVWS